MRMGFRAIPGQFSMMTNRAASRAFRVADRRSIEGDGDEGEQAGKHEVAGEDEDDHGHGWVSGLKNPGARFAPPSSSAKPGAAPVIPRHGETRSRDKVDGDAPAPRSVRLRRHMRGAARPRRPSAGTAAIRLRFGS